jgi:hypothetical protein
MNYSEYLQKHISLYSDTKDLSSSLQAFLRNAYEQHHIKVAPFFSVKNTDTEVQIYNKVNDLIRKQYRIKFHNVGKNPYQRYYKLFGGFEWLKLEIYLIQHFYSINKSESYISNRKIAIGLGYLDEREIDKELISKACRKVTDSLSILKNERKTISVEQRFNMNKRGSYHIIRAHWDKIITLYTQYNDKAAGSIRFRKSIRYRIISLMKDIRKFGKALTELLRKQKHKYLKGLIQYKNSEEFNDHKFAVFEILKDFKWMVISPDELTTDNIVPRYNHPELTLEVKSEKIYRELTYKNFVKEELQRQFKINTTIKPMF